MNRKVKAHMMLKGITSKQIATEQRVSQTWVSLVINGKGKSRRIREAIAKALNMDADDLWSEPVREAA